VRFVDTKDHREIEIPCGQCIGCRIQRQQMWAFRSLAEASLHRHNWFLTLTYSPDSLPPHGSLRHRDWQLFAKRARRRLGPFRYLMCGEYGEQTARPHYHALAFGLDLPDVEPVGVRRGFSIFRSAALSKLWGAGLVEIGSVTAQSARYCASYVLKDSPAPERFDESTGEVLQLVKPYGRMSLKPGLGDAWIRKYYPEVLTHGVCFSNDRQFVIPTRFKHILDEIQPEAFEALQASAIEKARLSPDNTPARLDTRERVALANRKRYKDDHYAL
jgi:hypothetical protein